LTFIRDHVNEPVLVPQVAKTAGISRRSLEALFRMLGRSVLSEIRRVRTAGIARLLVETDMPVSEIATHLGFEDAQHISRYFRQTQALSPLAFRKEYGRKHSGARADCPH
jgi:LacI family transcriptional regulator